MSRTRSLMCIAQGLVRFPFPPRCLSCFAFIPRAGRKTFNEVSDTANNDKLKMPCPMASLALPCSSPTKADDSSKRGGKLCFYYFLFSFHWHSKCHFSFYAPTFGHWPGIDACLAQAPFPSYYSQNMPIHPWQIAWHNVFFASSDEEPTHSHGVFSPSLRMLYAWMEWSHLRRRTIPPRFGRAFLQQYFLQFS